MSLVGAWVRVDSPSDPLDGEEGHVIEQEGRECIVDLQDDDVPIHADHLVRVEYRRDLKDLAIAFALGAVMALVALSIPYRYFCMTVVPT